MLATCPNCLHAADLGDTDWTAKLKESGWQENLPTVWVAEGLLYYMDPPAVTALLKVTHPNAGKDGYNSVSVQIIPFCLLSACPCVVTPHLLVPGNDASNCLP